MAVGSTAISLTLIAWGSFTVRCLGTKTLVGVTSSAPAAVFQPLTWLRSIALVGPQPPVVWSVPLKSLTVAPPTAAAQSRRAVKSLRALPLPTVTADRALR